ncbi:MAG: class I SAM-dependent methyltransferase [Clostridiaceae bacterium]|nr:class I SAM-dependent methyltransferase [Clostridiaceae bacterium]
MSCYNGFAEIYDLFMEDVDYNSWCGYIEGIFENYGIKPRKVLDTACGTGNITIPMSAAGYDIWGLDLSADMLAIAESKARAAKQKIRFLNQDMARMDLKEKFDAVLCMCDGVNYIYDEAAMAKYLSLVYEALEQKGIFIFDISSDYKIRYILGNNTFYEEKNNSHYIWNNNFDEVSETVEMDLIFFVPEEGLYKKFNEYHVQKAYRNEYLIELLKKTGFKEVNCFDGFSFDKPDEKSERIFFAAIKN